MSSVRTLAFTDQGLAEDAAALHGLKPRSGASIKEEEVN